jgi:fibronectin-binding autotransporter adhesin
MRASQTLGILILAGVLIVSVPEFAAGQDPTPSPTPEDAQETWTQLGTTDFNTSTNWTGSPTRVPTAGDVAAFSGAAVKQPNLSLSVTISGLYFKGTAASGYDLTRTSTQTLTLTATNAVIGNENGNNNMTVAIGAENTSGTNTIDVPIILGAASGPQTFIQAAGGTLVINGAISNTNNITLSLAGGGTFTLAGANTYTGGTTLSAGILQLGSNGVVSAGGTITSGPVGTGLLTLSNGTTLRSDGATNRTIQNSLSLSGTITLGATSTQTGTLTFNSTDGTHTLSTPATVTLTGDTTLTTLSSVSIADVISGSFNLTKAGASTLTLSGANTYTGTTAINAGTLTLANSLALQNSTLNYNNQGGTLSFGTLTSATFGGLSGAQNLALTNTTPANVALSVGNNNQNTTYSGVLSGGGSLTKIGSGTLILSGNNSYTGTTTVNAGKLFVNGNQTLATGTTTVNNSGTVLGGTGTIGGNVSIASSGAILEGGTGSTGQTLTITGSLTQVSGSIIELALGPTFTHSTLALTNGGPSSFYSTQTFTFIDLGATIGTYQDIITGVTSNPGDLSGWTITNAGYAGTFSWDMTDGGIDLTLTRVPEPGTWCAAALAMGMIGYSQRRRFGRLLKLA